MTTSRERDFQNESKKQVKNKDSFVNEDSLDYRSSASNRRVGGINVPVLDAARCWILDARYWINKGFDVPAL